MGGEHVRDPGKEHEGRWGEHCNCSLSSILVVASTANMILVASKTERVLLLDNGCIKCHPQTRFVSGVSRQAKHNLKIKLERKVKPKRKSKPKLTMVSSECRPHAYVMSLRYGASRWVWGRLY